jgi:RecB family endonuclease NucS
MVASRKLQMKYAGGLVKHLGLQMYAGAVPSIAELISNAWDADAKNVTVSIPLDTPITPEAVIEVYDDGTGMTFDEVNDLYLVVGLNRRANRGEFTDGGRPVLGRKGIGKLAGFGIARIVEVWTVKDGHLTAFEMDYEVITREGKAALVEPYEPNILHDRPVKKSDPLQEGTLVRLRRIQLKQKVNGDRFKLSMVRRFSVLSAAFRVVVNGEALRRDEVILQFRFPEEGIASEEVAGVGTVRWWAGFTEKPIAVDEARGIAVLARGKLVQAPFFFEISGGTQGQHGLQYLTGEVEADLLDQEVDLIATDRASVLWEDPRANPLLLWGQAKVRWLLREWSRKRMAENKRRLRDTTPYMAMVERFPEREQQELIKAIDTLASIDTITDERLNEIVEILIRAYENDHFFAVIRALNDAGQATQAELAEIMEEWDVIEAISTAQTVRGRVQVIRTFRSMIRSKVPEKPDMQDYVVTHPWLLNPAWDPLKHEKSLDRVVVEGLDISHEDGALDDEDGSRRLDFFCLADTSMAVVVEVKRPGLLIGLDELAQIERYVDYLRGWNEESSGSQRKRSDIKGCLVYSRLRPNAKQKVKRLERDGIDVVTWDQLLETAERLHREFLDVVKARAPHDDPRIERLDELDE